MELCSSSGKYFSLLLWFFNTSIFAKSMLFLRLGPVQNIFDAAKHKVSKQLAQDTNVCNGPIIGCDHSFSGF